MAGVAAREGSFRDQSNVGVLTDPLTLSATVGGGVQHHIASGKVARGSVAAERARLMAAARARLMAAARLLDPLPGCRPGRKDLEHIFVKWCLMCHVSAIIELDFIRTGGGT